MNSLPNRERLLPKEVALYLRVSVSTIYAWISSGALEAIQLPGKTIRISRTAIEKIEKSTTQ